jgi:hypothetical protein
MAFLSILRIYRSITSSLLSDIKDEDTSWKLVTVLGLCYIFVGIAYLFPKFWGISFRNSPSSSQGVIKSMVDSGYYREWIGSYHTYFVAHRFPFTIWVYSALATIFPSNMAFVFIIKNILFIPIIFATLVVIIRLTRPSRIIMISVVVIVFFNPSFIHTLFNIGFEEGFTIPLLAAFYLLLLRAYNLQGRAQLLAFACSGLIGGVLYLSKSSLVGLSLILPATVLLATIVRSHKRITTHHLLLAIVSLAPVLITMLMWGTFTKLHTGEFRINSSSDGMNFFKGNNSATLSYYPKDLDSLQLPLLSRMPHNEWQINDQFQSATIDFIVSHSKQWLKLTIEKCFIFFVDIRRTPLSEPVTVVDVVKAVFMLAFRILFFAILILATLRLFQITHREQLFSILLYIVFLVCYAVPFLAGFCYTRHVMPIMLPTIFLVFSITGGAKSTRSH